MKEREQVRLLKAVDEEYSRALKQEAEPAVEVGGTGTYPGGGARGRAPALVGYLN